ncbi:MAG: PIN domain-containing protein [Chloroflexota bacterium]
MSYLLDTTVVIDHLEGHRPAVELVARLFEMTSDLYTCDVVTCEALSKGDAHAILVKRTLLDALEYVALAPEGARWAGDRRREAIDLGKRKPSTTDALIAALAHSLGATVVTRNAKDFEAFDVPVLGYGEAALD